MKDADYQKIKDSCLSFIKRGGKIVRGTFGSGDCRCPISAFAFDHAPVNSYMDYVSINLDLSMDNLWDFIKGFDGVHKQYPPTDIDTNCINAFYLAGLRLREELGIDG